MIWNTTDKPNELIGEHGNLQPYRIEWDNEEKSKFPVMAIYGARLLGYYDQLPNAITHCVRHANMQIRIIEVGKDSGGEYGG